MAKYRPKRLTVLYIRKSIKKPGRHSDGPASHGLGVRAVINKDGQLVKHYEQKIRIRGRVTTLRLGSFPSMSLQQARRLAEANVRDVAEGRDPRKRIGSIFKAFTMEYIKLVEAGGTWTAGGRSRQAWTSSLINHAFPVIGQKHPNEITSAHIVEILQPIWITKNKTARDLAGRISKIMKYAKSLGFCYSDPAQTALDGMFPVHIETKHRKYVHYELLGEVLRIVAASDGDPIAVNALIFATLTGVRSGEARKATWDQFDIENRMWRIPAANVKNRREHFVPLSDDAIAVLEDTFARTGPDTKWVFPAPRGGMMHSDNLKKLLRVQNIDADVHGSRSSFRSWAATREDISTEAAEAVLAHKERNPYVRTTYYRPRIAIMNKWADTSTSGHYPPEKGNNIPSTPKPKPPTRTDT
jgi:integrase